MTNSPSLRLSGKVCVITGTGGSIGRAAAVVFAREGASVVGCDVNVAAAEATAEMVRAQGGTMISRQPCHLTQPSECLAVLREAISSGVNHIDTSDYYGPHVTNQLIREALHPYPDDLVIVTKIGARRGEDGSWIPASSPIDLTNAVHDNLRNLRVEVLHVVNLRNMFGVAEGAGASIEASLTVLADLQRQGLVRHIGLSNVTPAQIAAGRRICEIVCVQNHYNVAYRHEDALIDSLAKDGIAYVPFFPLGGFTPLQPSTLSDVAKGLGATPMQVALAWLLRRAPHVLLIPGTSSLAHLRENLAATELDLPDEALKRLDSLTAS